MIIYKIFFRFENALRQKIPSVSLPYWDCTLDQPLPHPSESVIWSDLFLGNGDGEVITGPFRGWDTQFGFGLLHRQVSSLRHLLSDRDLDNILKEDFLGNISFPDTKASRNLEQLHNNVHVWVGGVMRKIEIGAFDPVFYVLHAFIDKVWEDFRKHQRSKGIDPTKDYPRVYGRKNHAPFAPMGLGKLVVVDGISDVWNQNIEYLHPSCSLHNECESKFLRCDHLLGRCNSKTNKEFMEQFNINQFNGLESAISSTSSKTGFENLYFPSFLNNHDYDVYQNFHSSFNVEENISFPEYSENVDEISAFQKAKEIYTYHLRLHTEPINSLEKM